MEDFPTEIASARTFVFVREIEPLLNAGLIKGGDLDNAIVIYEKQMTQESFDKLADVMGVPHMDASQLGYINHIPLVWPNEPARHKLLDIIGDLALIGNLSKDVLSQPVQDIPSITSLPARYEKRYVCTKFRHLYTIATKPQSWM